MTTSLSVAWVPIEALVPYVNNARTHSDAQVDKIAGSIKEFGFTNPILTDGENGVIAGHGRLLAAKKLKLEKVPVIELRHLTDSQRRAYILADNRLAQEAGWDVELLRNEFRGLLEEGVDLSLLGFSEDEIKQVIADAMDDGGGSGLEAVYEVLIECESEESQVQLLEELANREYKCRALIS